MLTRGFVGGAVEVDGVQHYVCAVDSSVIGVASSCVPNGSCPGKVGIGFRIFRIFNEEEIDVPSTVTS